MPRKIVSVGLDVPSDDVEIIEFDSDQSLLDADIVLYKPTLDDNPFANLGGSTFMGKPSLSESASFRVKERVNHWKSELRAAFDAGKLVMIFLATPNEVYVRTGKKEFSGTGKNRQGENVVAPLSSYDAIPWLFPVTARRGTMIAPVKDLQYLSSYWSAFATISPYQVTIGGKFIDTLLVTKSGNYTVAARILGSGGGHVLLLPPIAYDQEKYLRFNEADDNYHWTDEAIQHGHIFVSAVSKMAGVLQAAAQLTPPPEWVDGSEYRLAAEQQLKEKIQGTRERIDELNATRSTLEKELQKAGRLRHLLYEGGKPLEAATLEALALFGFNARSFEDGASEFDAVFESSEGRCLGEVEGKDNRPIDINKLSQLERNIHEDFEKENVDVYAKGVLFGNAFRLKPVAERKHAFTDKCVAGAQRIKVALVRTPDMFEPARHLKARHNAAYARRCRRAIFEAEGTVVQFPDPPKPLSENQKGLK